MGQQPMLEAASARAMSRHRTCSNGMLQRVCGRVREMSTHSSAFAFELKSEMMLLACRPGPGPLGKSSS